MRRRSAELALAAGACTALSGCGFLPGGATSQAVEMHQVWVVFFWAAVFVAAIVWGLTGWCLLRWTDRGHGTELPPQFKRNHALEITWTAVPLVMVLGLFGYTYRVEQHVEALALHPALTVDVTGFRWSWRFHYPDLGVDVVGTPQSAPQLVLPLGETIAFDVDSSDVDHSFWVPAFLFKRDAIPGLENHFDWTPNRLGVFRGECGEFCGIGHADMVFSVAVVTPARFRAWVAAQRAAGLAPASSPPRSP